jgi:hypothetical protein
MDRATRSSAKAVTTGQVERPEGVPEIEAAQVVLPAVDDWQVPGVGTRPAPDQAVAAVPGLLVKLVDRATPPLHSPQRRPSSRLDCHKPQLGRQGPGRRHVSGRVPPEFGCSAHDLTSRMEAQMAHLLWPTASITRHSALVMTSEFCFLLDALRVGRQACDGFEE